MRFHYIRISTRNRSSFLRRWSIILGDGFRAADFRFELRDSLKAAHLCRCFVDQRRRCILGRRNRWPRQVFVNPREKWVIGLRPARSGINEVFWRALHLICDFSAKKERKSLSYRLRNINRRVNDPVTIIFLSVYQSDNRSIFILYGVRRI